MNTNQPYNRADREPSCPEEAMAAPAQHDLPRGGPLADTARGAVLISPDQTPPSRSFIQVPVEHVRVLLDLASRKRLSTDIDMAIIRETYMRLADIYAGLS